MNSRSITLSSNKSFVRRISPETIHLLTVLGAGMVAVSPILFYGFPSTLDLSNHFRFALPFYEALRSGHLYPGWLAESNNGFGDASFRFYPPALYYLLALARSVTGNWYVATASTFVIGSITLALYCVLRIDRKQAWKTIVALSISLILGLAASACYWATMVAELNWIRADNVNPDPGVGYRDNFVLSTLSPEHLNVWWMNILLFSMVAMFWPALILFSRTARSLETVARNYKSLVNRTSALALTVLLTLFMATPLSRWLWDRLHPLQETQFPWRWLAVTSLVCPLLLAFSYPFWTRLMKTRKRPLVMLAAGTVAISLAFSIGHIIRAARWLTPAEFERTLSG